MIASCFHYDNCRLPAQSCNSKCMFQHERTIVKADRDAVRTATFRQQCSLKEMSKMGKRKYGSEFIAYLEETNQIGSYCAEDSNYIDWLEKHLEVCRDYLSQFKEVADDCRVSLNQQT